MAISIEIPAALPRHSSGLEFDHPAVTIQRFYLNFKDEVSNELTFCTNKYVQFYPLRGNKIQRSVVAENRFPTLLVRQP